MWRTTVAIISLLLATTTLLAQPASDAADIAIVLAGTRLTADQVAEHEARLLADPKDVKIRLALIGNYFSAQRASIPIAQRRLAHVLWMIENEPRREIVGRPFCSVDEILDPNGFDAARKLWLANVERMPNDVLVLGNAASFFSFFDFPTAEKLLKKAKELEPASPEWPENLGQTYLRQTIGASADLRKSLFEKAIVELNAAYALTTDRISKFYMLDMLASASFNAGQIDKADEYAKTLLAEAQVAGATDWNFGNAIHNGNAVLGRIALAKGDVVSAKGYLLSAGKTKGSPQLDSFGPNLTLAKELIEKGERDVVIEYFELCKAFWKLSNGRLEQWSAMVRGGGMPDFGGNLRY